jgi:hypothetical protein
VLESDQSGATILTSTGYQVFINWDGTFSPAQLYYSGTACTGTVWLNDGEGPPPVVPETLGGKWLVFSGSQNTLMAPSNVTNGFATSVAFTNGSIDNPTCMAEADQNQGWVVSPITRAAAGLPATISPPLSLSG